MYEFQNNIINLAKKYYIIAIFREIIKINEVPRKIKLRSKIIF